MTKAAKIRKFYKLGFTVAEIAREVGCRDSYVRVCARQRAEFGISAADRRYVAANRERIKRYNRDYKHAKYWADPEATRKAARERWATDPEYRRGNAERCRAYRLRKAAKAAEARP